MGKIPCIKYNPNTWDYIKEQLESFGYTKVLLNDNWTIDPYIIINLDNNLGNYSNVSEDGKLCHNREIVNSTEEFLERAAKLMNKTYKRKDIMEINGVEIKPGMVLIGTNDENKRTILVAFPTKNGIGFIDASFGGWTFDFTTRITELKEIRDILDASMPTDGKLLWEAPTEVILTIDEIAKKFGVKSSQIRIKE